MSQVYILVEGVNIYANILDTNQLSVMRGSSFILKKAIDDITGTYSKIKNATEEIIELKAISTGASSGLYLLTKGKAKDAIYAIKSSLDNHKYFSLLTFIVVSCEANDLLEAKEKLLNKLRIQQMQGISQVPDILQNNNYQNFPDQLEGRRVAGTGDINKRIFNDKPCYLSESVRKRFKYGQKMKQDFYFDEQALKLFKEHYPNEKGIDTLIEELKKQEFCNDFEELANNNNYRKLNNKIAVIYMDGNSFSKKQRTFIKSKKSSERIAAQEEFDKNIQSKRTHLIYQILKEMNNEPTTFPNALTDTGTDSKGKIRLETLLWGGDESIFVVPAWLGFELLHTIFELTKDWELNGESLTHAAGIVFCHAKTPIRNIRSLAEAIADDIKDVNRKQNAWGYMVLESIDYPSNNDVNDFNHKYYGENLANTKPKFIPAPNDSFVNFKTSANKLINNNLLSKRQLYKIVHTIKNTSEELSNSWKDISELKELPKDKKLNPIEEQEFRLLQTSKKKAELLLEIKTIATLFSINIDTKEPKEFNNRIWLWVYLFDLWEYICPVVKNSGDKS